MADFYEISIENIACILVIFNIVVRGFVDLVSYYRKRK